MRGVRVRADSSSGLSPPLFSFLLSVCASRVCPPPTAGEVDGGVERGVVGGGVVTDGDEEDEATGRKEEDREQKEKRGKKR